MDYTVHGILQARILEWAAFSRGLSQVPRIADRFFTNRAIREALLLSLLLLLLSRFSRV